MAAAGSSYLRYSICSSKKLCAVWMASCWLDPRRLHLGRGCCLVKHKIAGNMLLFVHHFISIASTMLWRFEAMSLPSEVGALLTWLLQAEVTGSAKSSRGLKRIQKGQLPGEWQSSSKFWASFHGKIGRCLGWFSKWWSTQKKIRGWLWYPTLPPCQLIWIMWLASRTWGSTYVYM